MKEEEEKWMLSWKYEGKVKYVVAVCETKNSIDWIEKGTNCDGSGWAYLKDIC